MKKVISMLLVVCMSVFMLTACGDSSSTATDDQQSTEDEATATDSSAEDSSEDSAAADSDSASAETGYKVGFVTYGLGGDFFQMLADSFVDVMTEAGWEASYADGNFDSTTQINACENYIADGVDVLVCWSVAPEAMNSVVDQCQEKGIKFVSFVQQTEEYDAVMISDDAKVADYMAKLAAQWIDETYADAEDHSVPVAVFSVRLSDSNVTQADELLKIEEFSTKAKMAKEVELEAEDVDTGLSAAENLYTTNPEIKVFLTAQGGLAMGISNFYTGISSPVTDYEGMGVFGINGDNAAVEEIEASGNNESPFRGMVMTGSVQDTAEEILYVCQGLMDGSLPSGHVQESGVTFITADTAAEYLDTGAVTSLTVDDFQ